MWQAAKDNNTPLSLAVLNIDDFRAFNEQHGNIFADNVLRKVAEILDKALFRFVVARSGGKEFYVLLPGLDNDKALTLIDKVRGIVSREDFVVEGSSAYITCSGGVASELEGCLQDQLAAAESLMSRAKQAGKNIVFGEGDENDEDDDEYS